MEKITKEELLNNLGGEALSDEGLEKVSGGWDGQHRSCSPGTLWSDELNDCVFVGEFYY